MRKLIVIGLGHAWNEFYPKVIAKLQEQGLIQLEGTVDPRLSEMNGPEFAVVRGKWHCGRIEEIPSGAIDPDTMVMILTPDHYGVIKELAEMGFKEILCEKPLVSRSSEIAKVEGLVDTYHLDLYAIDFYLPKTLGLQVMFGLVGPKDPRYAWMNISDPDADFVQILGAPEGIGVQVIEAGDFCLPDVASRPYLANNKDIGGMILDLVTHVCGPLYQAGFLQRVGLLRNWQVKATSLERMKEVMSGDLVPIKDIDEVEMYVTALLEANGIPIHLAFGKVPFNTGGLWSLEIRGKKGMYYAGLRTGQPAVLVGNDGRVVTFVLKMSTYEFVVREALLYFEGKLPSFDGNFGAFTASMEIGQQILEHYDRSLSD
jgi:hypothetical protein